MLEVIQKKLRPLFLRKMRNSKVRAHKVALEAGMTARERELYLSGFEHGWVQGARDATTVTAGDLRPQAAPEKASKVH